MGELLDFVLQHEQFRKARLPSLYSDFRNLKTTNPNGFYANVTAWKTVLADACRYGKVGNAADKLVLSTGEDLVSQLHTQDWARPLALNVVVGEATYSKDLIPLDQFLRQRESIYHWSYASAAFSWGLEMAGLLGPRVANTRGMVNGRFVVVKNVEDMAKDISHQMSTRMSRSERVFTQDLFAEELAPRMSATDLKVLLRYLSRDRGECVFDGKTIKFKYEDEKTTEITEQDTTIARLKSLLKSLCRRVDALTADMIKCTEKAQKAVAHKNRTVALAALKSRKIAESALAQQTKALGSVEEVMAAIQQAADNIELMRILEKSSKVLNGLNKEVGGVERVDEVMESLKQETDTVDEVSKILGESGTVVDEGEVEDELEALLREEEQRARDARVLEELEKMPSAPLQKLDSLESMKITDAETPMNEQDKRPVPQSPL